MAWTLLNLHLQLAADNGYFIELFTVAQHEQGTQADFFAKQGPSVSQYHQRHSPCIGEHARAATTVTAATELHKGALVAAEIMAERPPKKAITLQI